MKKMIIMRGHSGSGKSTKARELAAQVEGAKIFSTDDFFVNTKGKYVFNATFLSRYHTMNKERTEDECEKGVPLVIIDNTNTEKWEYQPYIDIAVAHGYTVDIVVCNGDFKNTHGVSDSIIAKQKARFQL